jgi:phosphotransacetylase
MGAAKPVHVATPAASMRRVINLTALVATEKTAG